MRACLGIDPGENTGIALVTSGTGRHPGALAYAQRVFGARRGLWLGRATGALEEALAALPVGVALTVRIEMPPPVSRGGSLAGDRRGQSTWLGLGRRIGAWEALLHAAGLAYTLIPVSAWTRQLSPVVATKKRGDGRHRITEARHLLTGAEAIDRVDVAEAALIALGGVLP